METQLEYRLKYNHRHKAVVDRWRHNNKLAGRCNQCSRKAHRQYKSCLKCLKRQRLRDKENTAWNQAHNICNRCGKPKEADAIKYYCRICADVRAQRAKLKRRIGLNST